MFDQVDSDCEEEKGGGGGGDVPVASSLINDDHENERAFAYEEEASARKSIKKKTSKKTIKASTSTSSKREKNEDEDINSHCSKTKAKLKGSDLIFQRIKWDESINKEHVVVVYLDRFLGLQEIRFNDFKGVHEDYKEGIPFHRIRAYKLRGKVVWDRELRIDRLTGVSQHLADDDQDESSSHYTDNNVAAEQTTRLGRCPDAQQIASVLRFDHTLDKWCSLDTTSSTSSSMPLPPFVDTFKLITYNILSRVNFKKRLDTLLAREPDADAVSSALLGVDRMTHVNALLESEQADFVLLQECDQYEEAHLSACPFVRHNYVVCGAAPPNTCGLVLLSKQRPLAFRLLALNEQASKVALLATFAVRTSSLRRVDRLLVVNIHLTSHKASNSSQKRADQLRVLATHLAESDWHEADYVLVGGDFNFDDDAADDDGDGRLLLATLFPDFVDLLQAAGVHTFDPTSNLTAAITSSSVKPQRLDRLLYRARAPDRTGNNKCTLTEASLLNVAPLRAPIGDLLLQRFAAWANIRRAPASSNTLRIAAFASDDDDDDDCSVALGDEQTLHASDHFGLACTFRFERSLHERRMTHRSALAFLVPEHSAQLIERIRGHHDAQHERWPPHINVLYPFYDQDMSVHLDRETDERGALVGDLLVTLRRHRPFECHLHGEAKTFGGAKSTSVVFLEPDTEAQQRMRHIERDLAACLFSNSNRTKKNEKRRRQFHPHLTIAQPSQQAKHSRDTAWSASSVAQLITDTYHPEVSFEVDCVYWLRREDEASPFRVQFALPLGATYPSARVGLNPSELAADANILGYMRTHGVILDEEGDNEAQRTHRAVVERLVQAIRVCSDKEAENVATKKTLENTLRSCTSSKTALAAADKIHYLHLENESKALLTMGSHQHGIRSNDLDLALVDLETNEASAFAASLTNELIAHDDDDDGIFYIVRNVSDAKVPIIELCLKQQQKATAVSTNMYKSADVQLHGLGSRELALSRPEHANLFYDSVDYMKRASECAAGGEYGKLYPLSGIFENVNLTKYVSDYKSMQMLVSFVKHWAARRQIYGKAYGFLGGISWTILAIHFLRKQQQALESTADDDAGSYVLNRRASKYERLIGRFFAFYAEWNWHQHVCLLDIDYVKEHANRACTHAKAMCILQSVYPYHNTSSNVSDQCKRTIVKELKRAATLLAKSDKFMGCVEQLVERVSLASIGAASDHIQLRIRHETSEVLTHVETVMKARLQSFTTKLQRFLRVNARPYPNLFAQDEHVSHFVIELEANGDESRRRFDAGERQLIDDLSNAFLRDIRALTHSSDYDISFKLFDRE